MGRWAVFDDKSAAAVAIAAHVDPVISPGADYLVEALSWERESVLVIPSHLPAQALVAHFRRPDPPPPPPRKEPAVRYQATGFLGLTDEPVYEDEPAPPKKKWWRRVFQLSAVSLFRRTLLTEPARIYLRDSAPRKSAPPRAFADS